jgi:hypothetical protein
VTEQIEPRSNLTPGDKKKARGRNKSTIKLKELMSEDEFMAKTNAIELARDLRYRDSMIISGLDFTPIPGGLITMKRSK